MKNFANIGSFDCGTFTGQCSSHMLTSNGAAGETELEGQSRCITNTQMMEVLDQVRTVPPGYELPSPIQLTMSQLQVMISALLGLIYYVCTFFPMFCILIWNFNLPSHPPPMGLQCIIGVGLVF